MATEKRIELIDRNVLLEKAYFHGKLPDTGNLYPDGKEAVDVDDIEAAPTVDAVEVVHGRWERKPIGKYTGVDEVCCSVCGNFVGVVASDTAFVEAIEGLNYCPNCGARMDKKDG